MSVVIAVMMMIIDYVYNNYGEGGQSNYLINLPYAKSINSFIF